MRYCRHSGPTVDGEAFEWFRGCQDGVQDRLSD
jgi:hypothetical protein